MIKNCMQLRSIKIISKLIVTGIAVCASAYSVAADISRSVHQHSGNNSENGGYFELGMALGYREGIELINEEDEELSLSLRLNAGYQWNNLFIDLYPSSLTPFVIGYNLYDGKALSLDIVTGPQNGGFTQEDIGDAAPINERNFDYLAGLRLTHYYGNNILQVEARSDVSNTHNGNFFLAVAGRSWAFANGTQYALGGVMYQSKNTMDYYFGVRPEETSEQVNIYQADAGFIYKLEYGITYPLSPKWILRTSSTLYHFDDTVKNSPLTVAGKSVLVEADVSINYVF